MSYDPPLVHLPGTRLTPEVVLHRTMNKLEHIKAVVVIIQWDDETFSIDWSQMKVSDMAMSSVILNQTTTDVVFKGGHPND